jgi:predicted site-specific integrase-resolvase
MLTSAQAASVLEVDTGAVKQLLADGQIHAVQTVSGHIRVCKDSLFLM